MSATTRKFQPGDRVTATVDTARMLANVRAGEIGTVHGYSRSGAVEVRLGDGQLHTLSEDEITPAEPTVNPLEPTADEIARAHDLIAGSGITGNLHAYLVGAASEALRIAADSHSDARRYYWIRYARAMFAAATERWRNASCDCEAYDCTGRCCGIGQCSCTPAEPAPDGGEV